MNGYIDIIEEIKAKLEKGRPRLSEDKESRMYKNINPDINNYIILGLKTTEIEQIVSQVQINYQPPFNTAKKIFKSLARINIEEYKFAAFFFLARYKKQFDEDIPTVFRNEYFPYCHTWSSCDSCCIRVIGPFLAKHQNRQLAINTINNWSTDDLLWVKRASIVVHLKIIMLHKDFDQAYVFRKIDNMLKYSNENYIEKAIGWLLKTCSKYKPTIIEN
ncbi:MAG: DNA alkylation repair protein, partial [Candidatus Lokiarchaeota archaeon]